MNKEDTKHVMIMGSRGFRRNYGGWETLVRNLIENWKEENVQFYVSEIVYDKSKEEIQNQDGVICPQIYAPQVGYATMVLFCLRALLKSIAYVKEHRLKNVIFYIVGLRLGPIFVLLKPLINKYGIKVVINPDGFEWERAKWSWPVKKYFLLSESTMFKASDYIICDSQVIEDYVNKKYPKIKAKTCFIAYGAEVNENRTVSDEVKGFFEKNDIQSNEYYLIVGRFVPENNYELVIREFMKSKTNKNLVIISNIEENQFFASLKENTKFEEDSRIKFVGTVYDKEMLVIIRNNAFAYIHGHSAGGTNPSLLEAMATTDLNLLYGVPFNREVGGKACLYFDNNVGSLASLIMDAERLPENEIKQLGKTAKIRIKENYTWEIVVKRHEKVFVDLVPNKTNDVVTRYSEDMN